jgi:hypothetical protein
VTGLPEGQLNKGFMGISMFLGSVFFETFPRYQCNERVILRKGRVEVEWNKIMYIEDNSLLFILYSLITNR